MASAPTARRSRLQAEVTGLFVSWMRAPRFVRNAAISLPTFLIDLALLFLLVRHAHLHYLAATVIAFLIANGMSYFLARRLVFVETKRGLLVGLLYFLAIAAVCVCALTPLMWLSVSVLHIDVIPSRIASAGIVGVGGYLVNRMANFKVGRARPAALSVPRAPTCRRRPL